MQDLGGVPPRLAERVLASILPPEDRAPVTRDLEELFQLRCRTSSRRQAIAWYWTQVLSFATRQVVERLSWDRRHQPVAHVAGASRSSVTELLVNATLQDLRYAVRGFVRSPGFTLVAVVTLGLGIAASTSIFSVVNAILLRPLPYPESHQLVEVFRAEPGGEQLDNHSGANYLDIKSQSSSFAGLAGHRGLRYTVITDGTPQLVRGASVTSDFFDVLGVRPALGRVLSHSIDTPGSPPVVVLSYALWQTQFAGDIAVLGKTLHANDQPYAIIGVMPAGFRFPAESMFWTSSPYAVPESPVDAGEDLESLRNLSWFSVLGRLGSDVTLEQAQAEMNLIAERIRQQHPQVDEGTLLVPLHEATVEDVKTSLMVLLGAVGLLLLIACANVANLMLVRASTREREIAVRIALGAGRVRLMRQLVTESLVLALVGGAAGFLLALWGTRALLALAPDGVPRITEVGTNLTVLVFTLATATATGVLFGLAPAIQTFSLDAGRSAALGGVRQTAGRHGNPLRN
ncbi:MAG: ABC transporter permease, partial [Gemmatimonadota bacterium]